MESLVDKRHKRNCLQFSVYSAAEIICCSCYFNIIKSFLLNEGAELLQLPYLASEMDMDACWKVSKTYMLSDMLYLMFSMLQCFARKLHMSRK
jgi:hypothetical protein